LIDSIIHGFPVPEIYLQTSISVDGEEIHTLVDGQQRIRACMEFIADEFPLAADDVELEGKYFSDLSEELRGRIFRYRFVVRALPELSDAEVREIFGRLNRNNVALNRQELRHSTYWGEFITAMEEFSRNPFWILSGLFTTNDVRRMLDIEYISEIVVAGLYGLQNKKSRLDYFYATYESEFPEQAHAQAVLGKVIAQLSALFEWPNSTRWTRKVDFYTLFVELWNRHETLPLTGSKTEELARRLTELSDGVSRVLTLDEEERRKNDPPGFWTYARGVRNSSDLGSRRLRSRGMQMYVWQEDAATSEPTRQKRNPHLARLPEAEELMKVDPDDEVEEIDE
jgi:hypothetical protein